MTTEQITEVTVLPDGMEFGDRDHHVWSLRVTWRGKYRGRSGGGYSVDHVGNSLLRTSDPTDPEWDTPPKFRAWQFRWETLDEALAVARIAVNHTVVGRWTYAQRQAYVAQQDHDTNG